MSSVADSVLQNSADEWVQDFLQVKKYEECNNVQSFLRRRKIGERRRVYNNGRAIGEPLQLTVNKVFSPAWARVCQTFGLLLSFCRIILNPSFRRAKVGRH